MAKYCRDCNIVRAFQLDVEGVVPIWFSDEQVNNPGFIQGIYANAMVLNIQKEDRWVYNTDWIVLDPTNHEFFSYTNEEFKDRFILVEDALLNKHGRWTMYKQFENDDGVEKRFYHHKECSTHKNQIFGRPFIYCPDCGALMDEEVRLS